MSVVKSLKRHRGWIAAGALLAVVLVVLLLARETASDTPAPTYTTEAATRGTLSVTVDGTGYLAVRDEVEAYPAVGGDIDSIAVEVGDKVKAGDTLYTLDDTTVASEIASTEAARRRAAQSLDKAELELYRAKVSYNRLRDQSEEPTNSVTPADLEIAASEVAIAESGVSAAQADYYSAKEEHDDAASALNDLRVISPCEGVVWSVAGEVGDSVGASTGSASSASSDTRATGAGVASSASAAPVTIARDGLMGVELTVNEVDVTALKPDQDAEVLFDAVEDLQITGTVDEVAEDGVIESGVVTYSVWVTLDGSDERLKSGMSASATIVTQIERDVLLVANSAVKTGADGGTYVQVLAAGAAGPTDVPVVTGAASATQTVIESGLDEGAMVVTKTVTVDAAEDAADSSASSRGRQQGGIMMMGDPSARRQERQ
jgi:multidrug efflux pump subunit AcrA (membrane-fusion protein)